MSIIYHQLGFCCSCRSLFLVKLIIEPAVTIIATPMLNPNLTVTVAVFFFFLGNLIVVNVVTSVLVVILDADMEDYGFEYSDDEPEEQDVDIENQYYNSKGCYICACHCSRWGVFTCYFSREGF